MPTPSFAPFNGTTLEDVIDYIARLQKEQQWLLSCLDSLNVSEINTNLTRVSSNDGETIINGPVLEQYDKQAVPVLRLKQGYDAVTGKFVYALFDEAGNQTVGVDSTGAGTFTGTITGGTIQTAVEGNRIVITGNSLKTYRSFTGVDKLHGPVWGEAEINYGDLSFYDSDVETFRIENSIGMGWTLRPMNGKTTYIGYGGANTYATGDWNFINVSTLTGLKTNNSGAHTGTTGAGGMDGHTHSFAIPEHSHNVIIG